MFKNMKLGTKLQSIFLIISFMGFVVATLGIYNMSKIHDKAEQIYKRELMGVSYIKEANINLIYIGRARANYMLANSEEERAQFKELINTASIQLKANLDEAKKLFSSEKAKELFKKHDEQYGQYHEDVDKIVALSSTEDYQKRSKDLEKLIDDARIQASSLDNIFIDLTNIKQQRAKEAYDETTIFYENSRLFMILLVVCSTALGVGFGVIMTRGVTRRLGGEPEYAVSIAKQIADGDLAIEVVTQPKDKQSLLFAMKEMQAKLAIIVSQVKTGADTIATASGEIANGNLDLSHRTEEQASALEETASSMEEISATIKQTANNANEASKLTQNVVSAAQNSGYEVTNVLTTMNAIQGSSKQMEDIITVVESIAFQTNILALNAAVEAARAGEQGRGFAVVASEVRNLAHRSASASKEIKELINNSIEKVALGTEQARKAGDSMSGVVESIEKVSGLIRDISVATQEQSAGTAQINDAVMQMDTVTQQNAALVEEAAAASHSLQDQASILSQLVGIFKTERVSDTNVKLKDTKRNLKTPLKIENKKTKEKIQKWEEF